MFLLGRYRFEQDRFSGRYPPGLDVAFHTIHGVKGLEADYVVVPGMSRDRRYGFPSKIEDDPVLQVVMAEQDPFPHAEERRLFYVALTRARREVVLVSLYGQESEFVTELLKAGRLAPPTDYGQAPQACAACGEGVLVLRTGPYGEFWSCNRVPRCWGKQASGTAAALPPTTRPLRPAAQLPKPRVQEPEPTAQPPMPAGRESKPAAAGTVAQIAGTRWGIALRSSVVRFGEPGWSYREAVVGSCEECCGDLHVLRKPYVSGGRNYEYSALVCPRCARVFTLQHLGFTTYRAFVRGRQIVRNG